jgi:hypothetical protein
MVAGTAEPRLAPSARRTTVSTVLVGDRTGPVWSAAALLGQMVGQGVVRPFWFVDSRMPRAEPWPGTFFDRFGETEVPLFGSIGDRAADEIRVAVISTPVDPAPSEQVARVGDLVQERLRALAPEKSSVRMARLWFPGWEEVDAPDPGFFSTHVDANLVVIPEDRRSDQHFAAPISPETQSFTGHVAAETAVTLGMFAGMEGSAIDGLTPGVIFGDHPKVRLTRSCVRVGRSPALPLQEIVDHEGRLPVPPGTIEAPSPSAAVADLVARSAPIFDRLAFEVREPEPPPRHQLGPLRALILVLKEMGRFIISLPRRAVEGLFEDFSELAGRTIQDLIGGSSVVEVVWRGKFQPSADGEDFDALIADLKQQAERRLDLQGGPSIDQAVWRDMRGLVLSTADGSEPPPGIEPLDVHGQRAVVNDASYLAPRPQDSLVGTAKDILDESESGSPVSLLGRLGARIEAIARSNRTAVARLLETLDSQMAALANYRPPGYAFWHITGAVLFAALVVSLLLLTGAVRGWGVTELDIWTRNILFGALTIACVSVLVLLRSYGNQALREGSAARGERLSPIKTGPTWLGIVLGGLAGALFAGLAITFFGYPATEPATYAAILGGIVTGAGIGQAYSLSAYQEHLPALGRMSRLTILTVLTYVSVLVAGAIAQPDGWYATAPGPELRQLLWPVCGTFGFWLLFVLVVVSWRRVQERLALRWYGQSIRQLAEQVDAAFTADRVADAAREQFLGLSAVLSRLIWYPFGKGATAPDTSIDLVEFGLSKAAVCQFGLYPRGEKLFETRAIRLASERGWLTSQYEGSIQTFRAEQAVLIGSDDPAEVVRPDQDPRSVAQFEAEARPEKGDRWRWADLFFDGVYDPAFLHSLETHGEKEVFGPILADPGNFQPIGGETGGLSLLEFMSEVAPRGDHGADPRYFDPEHLATGAFERTWHHRTWWPLEELFEGGVSESDGSIDPVGSLARGAVWVAARSDSTEDLEPSAIFGPAARPEPALGEDEGPEF